MPTIKMLLIGAASLFLGASLTACGRVAVRTETVEVRVPVYVPLRDELTAPIFKPVLPAGPAVNDDLAGVCEARGAAIDTANQQFAKIRNLQPKTKTEAAK